MSGKHVNTKGPANMFETEKTISINNIEKQLLKNKQRPHPAIIQTLELLSSAAQSSDCEFKTEGTPSVRTVRTPATTIKSPMQACCLERLLHRYNLTKVGRTPIRPGSKALQ